MACGQLLPVSQNTALYGLLGTTFGGNGRSNFALPDVPSPMPYPPAPDGSTLRPCQGMMLNWIVNMQGIYPVHD